MLWVRLTFGQTYPLTETSGSQVCYYLVRLTSDQIYPQPETSCGQVPYYFCQGDLWSDVPPTRDILWPCVLLLPVRLTSGQMYPLAGTSCGQICYYFSQADLQSDVPPTIRLQVRLTFSQASGQADLWSDVPLRQRHLVAKCDTTSGQVNLFIGG